MSRTNLEDAREMYKELADLSPKEIGILASGGYGKEKQTEFLKLLKDAANLGLLLFEYYEGTEKMIASEREKELTDK